MNGPGLGKGHGPSAVLALHGIFFFFRFFVGDHTQTSPRPNHDRD